MTASENAQNAAVILIVEDDEKTLRLLKKQLSKHGFEIIGKSHGREGLSWLEKNHADLVILDLMLPDIDGLEVSLMLRKKYPLHILPILMLSALGVEATDRVRGLQAGANDFMAKPYHAEELVARVQLLLGMKSAMAAPSSEPTLLRLGEVADKLQVSLSTVRRLVKTGELKAIRPGKRLIRVRPADLDAYIQHHQ
jgi:excisionase family DNA binding protein